MAINSKDYHDYVIRDGKLIGEFDLMYKNCLDPWPESIEDMNKNICSTIVKDSIENEDLNSILFLGSGKGSHASWLLPMDKLSNSLGVELSQTACEISRKVFPILEVENNSIIDFLRATDKQFDGIIMREIIWYVLNDIDEIFEILITKYKGSRLFIELTFPPNQQYGTNKYNGINDFLSKLPFQNFDTKLMPDDGSNSSGYLLVSVTI